MFRCLSIVALLAGTTAADTGGEALTVDSHFYGAFFGAMVGGSLHFEHRPADSTVGFTLRASGSAGAAYDEGQFSWFTALVGLRRHWDAGYFEIEAGWAGLRNGRATDDFDEGRHYGVVWHHLPDLQFTFGGRIGPVDLGVFTQIPAAGLGLRLGVALD